MHEYTCLICIEKVGKHKSQDLLGPQSSPDVKSKYVLLHLSMLSQYHHFPRIWHPKHNQDALSSEHRLHLQHENDFTSK
jgi:hypothetical protein